MSLPRMSWHIGDYKKDTGHLRAAGHGAYILLCMHYWATGGLPDDDKQLATIACMTDREWKAHREILKAFFKGDGGPWKHKRVDGELAVAQAKYEKRAGAGSKGGNAKAAAKQCSSNATANGYQPITDNPSKKDSEADASAAEAAPIRDIRKDLFDRGRITLEKITGRTSDSCRRLLGKWLQSVNEDAIAILGAIDDAERNRIADPVPWIERVLHPKTKDGQRNSVIAAQDRLNDKLAEFNQPDMLPGVRGETRPSDVRLLSSK